MYKMYIIVNHDLKMGAGKIAGQVGHVVAGLTRKLERYPTEGYDNWVSNGEAKIVLKATLLQLEALVAKYPSAYYIRDAGLTQIEKNSLTVVGFPPLKEVAIPGILKTFTLR